jgi:hypothetical protein
MSVAFALTPVAAQTLGDLAKAVVDATAAEQAYYEGQIDSRSLRDLELFAARIGAERDLAAALVALGVTPEQARRMAEALA